jgi:hypothetical protein
MCNKVEIDIQNPVATISIDGVHYTYEELKRKVPKTQLESVLLQTVENVIKGDQNTCEKHTRLVDSSDVEELVESDAFKGDFHSLPLVTSYP